jgi:hypothetical protein
MAKYKTCCRCKQKIKPGEEIIVKEYFGVFLEYVECFVCAFIFPGEIGE